MSSIILSINAASIGGVIEEFVRAKVMGMDAPRINLLAAWIGIILGFGSGLAMGLFFHREQWLGGYSSLRRRLYRLGHISLFALGIVNLSFFLTARALNLSSPLANIASWCFILGAISMPVCCVAMAHVPRLLPLFGVPVLSLIAGGLVTVGGIVQARPSELKTRTPEPVSSRTTAFPAFRTSSIPRE